MDPANTRDFKLLPTHLDLSLTFDHPRVILYFGDVGQIPN